MIKSFRNKNTEKIWNRQFTKAIPNELFRKARIKLEMIDAANHLEILRIPPANHLEQLNGNREGQYSIRINDAWRICFIWKDGNAYDVEIVQYHSN
ncbi:MAG: type II toxin-antitoxin system RelE/ParE family toxin [Treponema sp.]